MIKAEAISKMTGEIVLADDSGLEIDYLNKSLESIPHAIWVKVYVPIILKTQT